ncbi:MAG: trypsin-like peptidase domain-containing protein [Oscillospiraceae bacterium]|nr:trypsin-like peptidase domain-containing protein [Oscillospiraceae bacterium]
MDNNNPENGNGAGPEMPELPELPRVTFEPVFMRPVSAHPEEQEPSATPAEARAAPDSPGSPPDTGAPEGMDYSQYGYARAAFQTMERPKRSKSGIVFGMLAGMVLALTGMLIAVIVMGGNISIGRGDFEYPWWQSEPEPPPLTYAPSTLKPSGGGDAKLDIVQVEQGQPESALGGGPLTNREVVRKGRPSVVCVLGENASLGYLGMGSGIIMAEEGQYTYIITNEHVVSGYDTVNVLLHDGEEYPAILVGMDQLSDLAVVKIKVTGLQAAEFGNSDAIQVGDPVVVIGNPVGIEFQGTATAGMVSAINRSITVQGRAMTLLQTDASVNHGNSGGPMFNEYGQVVGIISSKIMGSFSTVVEGLGFAIPITIAKPVIDDLISLGYVSGRPTIGISDAVHITASESRFYHVPRGVRVLKINENSDAFKQGLRIDDIIFQVNGEDVYTVEHINRIKNQFFVGDSMTVTVYRERRELDITFVLMEEGQLQ